MHSVREIKSNLQCTPRPRCPRFRAQSFLLQGNMKTLCGYMTLLLKLQTMLGLFKPHLRRNPPHTITSGDQFHLMAERKLQRNAKPKDSTCTCKARLRWPSREDAETGRGRRVYDQRRICQDEARAGSLSVRRKNTKEMFGGFFKSVVKSADEVLFSGVKEVDDFFEQEKNFLINYYNRIKDSCAKADRMTRSHKNVADDYIHTAACLHSLALEEPAVIKKYLLKVAELFEKLRKVEGRVSSDEDLKLTELLRYYMLNIEAAKDLLYRRTKALIDYENSNKALDKARLKSKDVKLAEAHQQECCQKFEQLSESAKEELINFKRKRVAAFRKNLIEMSELEIKHARNNVSLLQSCIDLFKNN
ncbi:sorting nexin-5 isoform X2 [Hippopotamus amphibius kiboko]|uniref:sorting nexin-5 isoform X2 n=1 Tax=Hippopotamus amphibius kiboko TaxID=575201 RepID=UPI002591F201|nr:sorting nexin-5 isoform X2 [Hippopotamus amphibius kiboko]XP_057557420.1 sorting nexin-5 isoform X2 [Hippopotamus amphibius kiboko]XP_057557421.1 sorting nexin-5 isoform X2 [Hippopotamus amphibius kiboko]